MPLHTTFSAREATNMKLVFRSGQENFEKGYPCFAAVNRAANGIKFLQRYKDGYIAVNNYF